MTPHKDCHYYRSSDEISVECSNHINMVHDGFVPLSFCENCKYYTTKPVELEHVPVVNKPCVGCPDNHTTIVPAREGSRSLPTTQTSTIRREEYTSRASVVNPISEPRDRDWAVVVTTSPRSEPTIERSVQSIKQAGWNPIVFAEPDSIHLPDVKYIANEVRLGSWFNWLKSVKWALKNTTAQHIMTVQDDSLFHPDSRSFAESVMWPSHNVGFLSLYTASHYSADLSGNLKPLGINKLRTSSLWGACALIFPRHVLQSMIEHPVITDWKGIAPKDMDAAARHNFSKRREESPQSINNIDSAIGRVLTAMHLDMFVVDPSPVRHISPISTLHHGSNTGKRNCGRCADHLMPLEPQVFPNKSSLICKQGTGNAVRKTIETEIGYEIVCETCLEFFRSIDSTKYSDLQDLVLKIFTYAPFPDGWRKKYIGRTKRLQRIEELIKPLVNR